MTKPTFQKADTFNNTDNKILNFKNLQPGWHYGEGIAPNSETITLARILHAAILRSGISETDAFPGIEGEVQITGYDGPDYLELTVEPEGKVTFVCEHNDVVNYYADNLSVLGALDKVAIGLAKQL